MSLPLYRQVLRTRGACYRQCFTLPYNRSLSITRWLHQEEQGGTTLSVEESYEAFNRDSSLDADVESHSSKSSHVDGPSQAFLRIDEAIGIQNAHPPARRVKVKIDDSALSFAPMVLRDLCSCSQCVDPSTRQKLFYTPDIPFAIEAQSVKPGKDDISITWRNDIPGYNSGHVTRIPLDSLRRIADTGKPEPELPPIARSYWDAATFSRETDDFSYEAYMSNDSVLLKAVKQLHTHGLLFVSHVPEDEESVVRLAERIGPLKTTFYGKTWDVRSVPNAKNVAYTAQNLGFHMDLMYMEQPPHLQLLHCIRSSSSGGASLFSDSFKAVHDIAETDEHDYNALSSVPVSFHYDHPGEHYYHRTRTVIEQAPKRGRSTGRIANWKEAKSKKTRDPDDQWLRALTPLDFLSSVAWSPPFQAPFRLHVDPRNGNPPNDRSRAVRAYDSSLTRWHRAAAHFNTLIHREDHIYERLMRPGQCVIFDNRRVLHARRAFDVGDVGKERWLKGAYIDRDPYLSKLKVLRELGGRVEST